MNKPNDQIKYVVTEGGEVLGAEIRVPRQGERFLKADDTVDVSDGYQFAEYLVLTELDTPPFVDREVVEPLVAAAKDALRKARHSGMFPEDLQFGQLIDALPTPQEALNPKPRERWHVNDSREMFLGEIVVAERDGKRRFQMTDLDEAEELAALLNAQVGDAA